MIDVEKIKKLMTDQKITLQKLSKETKITPQGLLRIFRHKNTTVQSIESICKVLNCHVCEILTDGHKEIIPKNQDPEKVQYLERIIEDKNQIIDLLKDKINKLLTENQQNCI